MVKKVKEVAPSVVVIDEEARKKLVEILKTLAEEEKAIRTLWKDF